MAEQPSRQVLDGVPGRVLTYLVGVGKYFPIRTALGTKGYNEVPHDLAWSLLKKLSIFPASTTPTLDKPVRDAVLELDAWDEPNYPVIRAVLENNHPEVVEFVFENLTAKQGPESVVGISLLLDRWDAMESGPGRKATRKTDQAALETLAARGYTSEERTRLRGLVNLAQNVVMTKPISDEERETTLRRLHAWYNEWSAVARLVLTRRDHQIAVGIAKRRKPKKGEALALPVPPVVKKKEEPAAKEEEPGAKKEEPAAKEEPAVK